MNRVRSWAGGIWCWKSEAKTEDRGRRTETDEGGQRTVGTVRTVARGASGAFRLFVLWSLGPRAALRAVRFLPCRAGENPMHQPDATERIMPSTWDNEAKVVLVTGASSGLGKACALDLVRRQFRVLAGVRSEAAAAGLREASGGKIETVRLDITEPESVAGAVQRIRSTGLYGLVNNAGSALLGPTEFLSVERIRAQFEVNVFGHIGLTQALLPVLRESRGRVVNMSSISGRVAFPFAGPYAASKFALEAFSDALRRELRPSGVAVILIEPGNMKTEIWSRSAQQARAAAAEFPPEAWALYGERLSKPTRSTATMGDPARVAEAVARALTAKRPRPRYLVGRDAKIYAWLARLLPDRWLDRAL